MENNNEVLLKKAIEKGQPAFRLPQVTPLFGKVEGLGVITSQPLRWSPQGGVVISW